MSPGRRFRFNRAFILMLLILAGQLTAGSNPPLYLKATLYQDWMGLKIPDAEFYNRISSRLKLTLWNRPGDGWTVNLDVRNRTTLIGEAENQLIIYDAFITYDNLKKKLFFSLGQMNLYDSVGAGELAGGVMGIRLNRNISLGAYAGIEPDIYHTSWDTDYLKFGLFARYLGSRARRLSLSYNQVLFAGETERRFITASLLWPLKNLMVLYGNLEYNLGNRIRNEDRLAQIFFNVRLNLSRYADLTGHYSSGRGLDYHEFLLEQSRNPGIENLDIDRYYYNTSYGIRVSLKPLINFRIYAERRESENIDEGVRNHTTRFGLSTTNIFKSGVSFFGHYNLNRGQESESDSFYLSLSRSFGRLSLNLSFANFYNGTRLIDGVIPEIFHLPDQLTLSADIFIILSKALAVTLEYAYTNGEDQYEHQFFIRLIYRR